MTTSYELFYNCGGHGGPYRSLDEAREAAKAKLRGSSYVALSAISIVLHDPTGVGGYGRIVEKITRSHIE